MQTIFDSKTLPVAKRREAWQDAICEIYLRVDCAIKPQTDYDGFVRETRLGGITLTDTLGSPQIVQRHKRHIARIEKDCYYMGLVQRGIGQIRQAGSLLTLHPGCGALYYASEPYEIRCDDTMHCFWIEIPRQVFADRFDSGHPPLTAHLNSSRGLGRIAVEFCGALISETASLDPQTRERLGEQLMDILALAMSAEPDRQPADEFNLKLARLRSVKSYIEAHLSDPDLTLRRIAAQNGISLRYLHQLFRPTNMSVTEWLRLRRLQHSYDLLASPRHAARSITEIAYSMGFSSSSHFSNLFRAEFGVRPSDVRGTAFPPGPSSKASPIADGTA
jgi:AraC-like DNA-binding protein